jgi:hypothetical protein
MERVTGIGGLFFRAKDPKALRQWYQQHLGVTVTPAISRFSNRVDVLLIPDWVSREAVPRLQIQKDGYAGGQEI